MMCFGLLIALGWPQASAAAQDVLTAGPQRASRADLNGLVADLERQMQENARGLNKARVQNEIDAIKQRLVEGDFRTGDQFVVTLITDVVRADTVSVRDSLLVGISSLPDVSLRGVLRSELTDHLNAHVSRYLRNAQVRANVLTRVSIVGAVARPGYFLASPDKPVSELLMLAGGPAPDAKLGELEIHRSGTEILSSKASKQALKEGRTLEQLGIRSGDEVRVAKKKKFNWQLFISIVGIATTLFFAVVQFLQFYYRQQDQ